VETTEEEAFPKTFWKTCSEEELKEKGLGEEALEEEELEEAGLQEEELKVENCLKRRNS
jgi:hypothetical protein